MTDNSTGHAVPDEGAASPRWRHVTKVSDYYLAEFGWDGVRVERDPRTGRWIVLTPGVYEAVPLRETFTELRDARAAAFAELGCEPPPDTASPDGDVAERARYCREWGNFDDLHAELLAEVERLRAQVVLSDEQEHQAARYLQDQTAIASIGLCRTFVRGMVKRVNEVRGAGL